MRGIIFISALICATLAVKGATAAEGSPPAPSAPPAGALASAEATAAPKSTAGPLDLSGPIVITARKLLADGRAGTALFEGSVLAKRGDISLHAGRMMVIYSKSGEVLEIKANGDVKLVRGSRVITAQWAHYTARDEKIVFTGEPRASERGNVITGSKITYLMAEDRSQVENSTVFIKAR